MGDLKDAIVQNLESRGFPQQAYYSMDYNTERFKEYLGRHTKKLT
jgi:hypothetical protein